MNRKTRIIKFTALILISWFTFTGLMAQSYPPVFDVTTLDGTNGFTIVGFETNFKLGRVAQLIGDINNDGFEDICLGNGNMKVGTNDLSGRAYIIFGSATTFPTPFDLTSLNGTNGFIVEGVVLDERRGTTVAGPGDINGDGIDDLIVGTSNRTSDDIVIYGATTFPSLFTVNDINGTNGFLLDTPGGNDVAALGDVNGDGINDFIIGTPHFSGQAWIVFGRSSNYPALIDISWLDGIKGFRTSNFPSGRASYKVGGAGDINNDGINDILIGSWNSSSNATSYALFGKNTPFDPLVDITAVDGTDGFLIDNQGNAFITKVGPIGDINGDGIDDCFSENNIIFGSTSAFPASLLMSDLNGANGFVLENHVSFAAPVGDLNLDGVDDFIVSASASGDYVIFGTTGGFSATFNAATLDGTNGFRIPIANIDSKSTDGGKDINGDGFSDFVFGNTSFGSTGAVHVIFGGDHFAMNLNTGYPQAINETASGFTLLVNGPETGTIHYAIYPGNFSSAVTHDDILNGTGAVTNGDFLMNPANTDISEIISSLTAATTYDVYLFLEDGTGNHGEIYHLDDITTLSITDTEAPVITCPSDQELDCNTPSIPDYTGLVTVTDNQDPNPVITQNPLAGTAFTDGMTITITATDASTNSDSCTFIVNTTADTEAPVVTCPADQNLAAGSTIPDYTSLVAVTDNCDTSFTIVQTPSPGSAFVDGMTITMTVTDSSSNSDNCSFIINETSDTEAPVITCPSDQELVCNTPSIPDYTGSVTVTDNQDPNPVLTQNPLAGTAFTDGTTITITATDASTNSDSCTFIVNTAVDTEAPVVTCPADQNLAAGSTIPDYTSLVAVTDNCDTSFTIVQSPAAGTSFTNGMTITMTVTDSSSNSDNCSFIINETSDTEAPIITCPSDQELDCNTPSVPDYTGSVTVTDNQDPNPVLTQNPAAGTAFTDGMTITVTATDASTNSDSCTFIVNTAADTEAPVVTCPADRDLAAGSTVPDYTSLVSVTDNCDTSFTIVQTPSPGSAFVDGMAITMTVTDSSSNSDNCLFIINETSDTEAPVITCPSDQELDCNTPSVPDYTGSVTVTDNQDPNPVLTQNPAAGTAFTDGMTITVTATDASTNSDSCTFIVNTAADTEAPIVTCPADQNLTASSTIPDYTSLVAVTDNCDTSFTIVQSPAAGTSFTNGMTITMTVTDSSSNSDNCSFIINETSDTEAPVITCPSDQELDCNTPSVPDYTGSVTVTDNQDPNPVLTQNPLAGTAFTDGMTITVTATDASTNSDSCAFIVSTQTVSVDAGIDEEIIEGQEVQLNAIATDMGTFLWSPSISLNDASISNPIANPTETTIYTVIFTTQDGCIVEDTVTISVEPEQPDDTKYGFSPDNDGINEFWKIGSIENYPNNRVLIYNRWGDLVFEIEGYNNTSRVFRGIANRKRNLGGDELPEGTYFFDIKIEGTHTLKKLNGFLVLKR